MHETFLQDLAVVMIVAGLVTVLFHRLRQPVVLGYILAGAIIGPHTPPFPLVQDAETIDVLAELGVIFLLFSLGLHFSLRQLWRVGATAVIAAVLEILLMLWIGYEVGRAFGWGAMNSIFLGAILSISSTTIIVKALVDTGRMREDFAKIVFGILIVEDILAIAMIAFLSTMARTGALQPDEILTTSAKLALFLTVVLVAGLLLVPWTLRRVARFHNDEVLLVTVLALLFGLCLLATKLEYSVALGAFLMGALMAETRQRERINALIEPLRDVFSAVFFVAVGMLIDPRLLVEHAAPILIITVAVVVGKVLTCSFGTLIAGHGLRTSLRVGMSLAQIGEFSFIIAQLGLSTGVTDRFVFPVAVMVSAITTLLTPYLIRSSDHVATLLERDAPRPVLGYLELYSQWVARRAQTVRMQDPIRKLIRKTVIQTTLNVALVTALFLGAAYFAQRLAGWQLGMPAWTGGTNAIVWLGTMLLAVPLLAATLRKVRAMAMLLAEMIVQRRMARGQTFFIRNVVSTGMLTAGAAMLGLYLLVLSSAILPPWPVLIVMLLIVAAVTVLRWQKFIQLYARAQVALLEAFEAPPPQVESRPGIPAVLRAMELETIRVAEASPAVGRKIHELQLRTRTGASAVAIERQGRNIVNPRPEETLEAGDELLLLGDRDQLTAARTLLQGAQ